MSLSFEDVKKYLAEEDSVAEAEAVLLENIKKSSEIKRAAVLKNIETKNNPQYNPNTIKISDLLQSIESDHKAVKLKQDKLIRKNDTTVPSMGIESSNVVPVPETQSNIEELEKVAQEEIFQLEARKLAIQRKVEDQKKLFEKKKLLDSINYQNNNPRPLELTIAATYELQRQLLELSESHAEKAAEQRINVIQTKRELDMINSGQLQPKDSSIIQAITKKNEQIKLDDSRNSNSAVNDEESADGSLPDDSFSEKLLRKSRVDAILNRVSDPEYLAQKQKRIESWKARDDELKQYGTVQVSETLSKLRSQSASGTGTGKPTLLKPDGRVDRSIPISEFLDRWLQEDVSNPANKVDSVVPKSMDNQTAENQSSNKSLTNIVSKPKLLDLVKQEMKKPDNALLPKQSISPEIPEKKEESAVPALKLDNEAKTSIDQKPVNIVQDQPLPSYPQYYNNVGQSSNNPLSARISQAAAMSGFQNALRGGPAQLVNQQPNMLPPYMQPAGQPSYAYPPYMNPHPQQLYQDPMMMQFQKMNEQLEFENMRLQQQLGGLNPAGMLPNNNFIPPGMDVNPFGNPNFPNNMPAHDNSKDFIYRLDRDDANVPGKQSREELRKQQEIRMIQYDLEKLKQQQDYEEFKEEYERKKIARQKQAEYDNWLEDQKREFQKLKMQQVMAKEKKLLGLQMQDDVNSNSSSTQVKPEEAKMNAKLERIKEECGVGSRPLPLDVAKGITIVVDGTILPNEAKDGLIYRVALGLYDNAGRTLVRLQASEWTNWTKQANTSLIEVLDPHLVQTLKFSDVQGLNALTSKALLEVQVKDNDSGAQRSVGWGAIPFAKKLDPKDDSSLCLTNNCWSIVMRKGISDPLVDVFAPSNDELMKDCCFLIRVAEFGDIPRATGWNIAQSDVSFDDIKDLYTVFSADGASVPPPQQAVQAGVPSSAKPPSRAPTPGKPPGTPSMKSPSRPPTSLNNALPPNSPARPPTTNVDQSKREPPLTASMQSMKQQTPALPKVEETHEEESPRAGNIRGKAEDKAFWFLGSQIGPASERYQRGDGIDIYIDAARFLPDNCTITRVNLRLFSSTKEQIGSVFEGYCEMNSPAMSPIFRMKAECRANAFNATATGLLRFDTLDSSTLLPVSVGYSCFKIFCSRDRIQPKDSNEPNVFINTGLFQVPIHGGRFTGSANAFDETMLSDLPKIPCASALVRVYAAPKSADGISTLSRDEFPKEDWSKLGLDIPMPDYTSGAYSGILCEPNAFDQLGFEAKSAQPPLTAESFVLQCMNNLKDHKISDKPNGDANDRNVIQWWKSLLPPISDVRRILDYSLCTPYSAEGGLSICIEGLYNIPEPSKGLFGGSNSFQIHKAIYSLSPPGLFYKDPPLYDGVQWTKSHDLERSIKFPGFLDGFVQFSPAEMAFNLYVILDIRVLTLTPSKKVNDDPTIAIEPPTTQRKCYWTLFPLSREKCANAGYRYIQSGYFQLPLFEGPVPSSGVLGAMNPYREVCNRLGMKTKNNSAIKLSDGMSVLIKVYNPLIKNILLPEIQDASTTPDTNYLTGLVLAGMDGISGNNARVDKFTFSAAKYNNGAPTTNNVKKLSEALPKSNDINNFMRNVNKEFQTSIGIPIAN